MASTKQTPDKPQALVVEFSTWRWTARQLVQENVANRRLGLPLTEPGWYAQRRKADRSGYYKARRFGSKAARDRYVQRETERLMQAAAAGVGLTLVTEHPEEE